MEINVQNWVNFMNFLFAAHRVLRKPLRCAVVCLAVVSASASVAPAQSGAFIVGNDRGGIIGNRAAEVQRLNNAGRRVEIRGRICLSSCTMYLGAGDVCVSPDTRFGFHGPSYYGQPLLPQHFEFWSEVLASHYPPTIRNWFMSTARHKQSGYYTVRGTELIRHGIPSCS